MHTFLYKVGIVLTLDEWNYEVLLEKQASLEEFLWLEVKLTKLGKNSFFLFQKSQSLFNFLCFDAKEAIKVFGRVGRVLHSPKWRNVDFWQKNSNLGYLNWSNTIHILFWDQRGPSSILDWSK